MSPENRPADDPSRLAGDSPSLAGDPPSLAGDPPYFDILNAEQRKAVVHQGAPLLILAGAGSGKTRVITTKIAYLVDRMGMSPRSILAVTFTNKAAGEMRERVLAIVPHAQDVMVRTFHSFGAWFLRRNAAIAGLEPRFHIYDEDDSLTLVPRASVLWIRVTDQPPG